MYLFDDLLFKNILEPHLNFDMNDKKKVLILKDLVTYYFTKFSDKLMFYNVAGTYEGFQMYWNSASVLYNLETNKRKLIFKGKDTISHNFTPIMNDPNRKNKYYAVGGCGKKGKWARQSHRKYKKGIYLLESTNLEDWNVSSLILDGDKYKGWNPVHHESIFDSNIECFYSKILKKYLLFTRYNYGVGSRTIQLITSPNYTDWDAGIMCNIDTYKAYDNYYMCKIQEIPSLKIFVMISPYSVLRPPLEYIWKGRVNLEEMNFVYGFKLLISKDAVNWKDCGMLAEVPPAMKHDATPVMQPTSLRLIGKFQLEIEYHDLYFTKQSSTIFRNIVDLRRFLGVKIKDTTILNKTINLKNKSLCIEFEKLPNEECCTNNDYDESKVNLSMKQEIDSTSINEETEIEELLNLENETLSYSKVSTEYPSMISAYAHPFQTDVKVAEMRDNLLAKFKVYQEKMENKIKKLEEKIDKTTYKKCDASKQISKNLTKSYIEIIIDGNVYPVDENGNVNLSNYSGNLGKVNITIKARNIILYSIN